MSAMGVSGPVITQVQLTGPADEVSRLMQVLSGVSEVIFGPVMQPGRGGDVSCTAQVVTHPSPEPVPAGRPASVTVQVELEVEADAVPGLPGTATARQVEESVAVAVSALPGVRGVSSRLVASVGLPAARE
ncbi:hypothetical protein OG753_04090 [Streptomyces sp. NBC_00029]|uniref:hypothetical protein n=1 Tax=Streptomyces sp. NBC_00029 TaxID=2903613 RepID=UPI0032440590